MGMYVALRDAIEHLDEPALPGDLVEAFTLLDQLTAHLTHAVGRLERSGAFETETLTSPSSWLTHFARRTGGQASTITKAARKIIQLPVTGNAWRDGTLSSGHVDAILANVKARHVALFAEAEGEMVPKLAPLSVHDATIVMRWWATLADDALPDADKEDPAETLHLSARSTAVTY
jgi:hypothetical protein